MKQIDAFTEQYVSFFAALCLFLSAVEYAIPKPFPFMRLGLANLPVLLSLFILKKKDIFLLVVFKILGQALISGTLFSYIFIFSAAGSLASAITMVLLYSLLNEKKCISFIGLSVAGSFANNIAQIACARFILFGENVKYIAPVLLVTGMITGILLGVFAELFTRKSQWYALILQNKTEGFAGVRIAEEKAEQSGGNTFFVMFEFAAVLIISIIFLFQKNAAVIWIFTGCFFIVAAVKKRGKIRIVSSLLMVLCILFFSILLPYGKVLFSIGKLKITEEALNSGLVRSGKLIGMVYLSQTFFSADITLPGKAGVFIARIFKFFNELNSEKIQFKKGSIISVIDERLLEIWKETVSE